MVATHPRWTDYLYRHLRRNFLHPDRLPCRPRACRCHLAQHRPLVRKETDTTRTRGNLRYVLALCLRAVGSAFCARVSQLKAREKLTVPLAPVTIVHEFQSVFQNACPHRRTVAGCVDTRRVFARLRHVSDCDAARRRTDCTRDVVVRPLTVDRAICRERRYWWLALVSLSECSAQPTPGARVSQALTDQQRYESHAPTQLSRAGWGKLAMWLFLASDGMTFGGLLTGYAVLRSHSANWPQPSDHFAFALGFVMTALLLGSSITMVKTRSAAKDNQQRAFRSSLLLTITAGVLFVTLQAYEWRHLLQEGMTLSGNPWGAPLFGATFYTLTGFHGLHVLAGVIYLGLVLLGGMKRPDLATYQDRIEIAGLYWHFVDIVWIFVFTSVYLL